MTMTQLVKDDLAERLSYHQEDQVTGKLVLRNPDGPEAAARITELEAQLKEARDALKPLHEALDDLARIIDSKARDGKTGDFIFTAREWYGMHCIVAFAPEPDRRAARAALEAIGGGVGDGQQVGLRARNHQS